MSIFYLEVWLSNKAPSSRVNFQNTQSPTSVEKSPLPYLRKVTKSTEDPDNNRRKEVKNLTNFNKPRIFPNSLGSGVGSMRSIRSLTSAIVLEELAPSPGGMNQLSSRVKESLEKLQELDPQSISEIKEVYDSQQPRSDPYIDPFTQMTYQGQMLGNTAHGWGRAISRKGDLAEGFFVDGVLDGYCRMLSRKGVYYEGGIADSLKHGRGILTDQNGVTVDSKWDAGKASVHTTILTEEVFEAYCYIEEKNIFRKTKNGHIIIFQGDLSEGRKTGYCYFFDTHARFAIEGYFKDDKITGLGKKYYFNSSVYYGNFKEGVEEGEGTLYFTDGRIYSGSFAEGKPHGTGTLTTDTGISHSCKYVSAVMKHMTR